ncbi:MAG: hypothetical protein GXO91_06150 [FCB group bacterium]|nr:hypothetical protein [FCB group bacterium]
MKTTELLDALQLNSFIALDLETTGLTPGKDAITELSAYRFEKGVPVEEFASLVNPLKKIPPEIVELTGITDEMVKSAPTIDAVLPELMEFIGSMPLVGHMIKFDISFLEQDLQKNQFPQIKNEIFDTLILARTFLFFHHEFNLSGVSEYFGYSSAGAHRAGADTKNTGLIFVDLIHEAASYPLHIIQKLYDAVKHTPLHGRALLKSLIDQAVSAKEINGLVSSKIEKKIKSFCFSHESASANVNIEKSIPDWFGEGGVIPSNWKDYESRKAQAEFAADAYAAFCDGQIHLAEAGTGLGKSLAYLSAGLLNRKHTDIPLVVSTYTKNLQDQLFYKDLPALASAVDIDTYAIILKGRQNYLCKTRLERLLQNSARVLTEKDCEDILPLLVWVEFTESGDVSECNGFMLQRSGRLWSRIRSESGYCTSSRCDRHDGCFLRKVRDALGKADIIVVNHALLTSDMMQGNTTLPPTFCYVIDEGHNFERAARDQLISRINERSFDDIFTFFSDQQVVIGDNLTELLSGSERLTDLQTELTEKVTELQAELRSFFSAYIEQKSGSSTVQNPRYEVTRVIDDPGNEFAGIQPSPEKLSAALKKFNTLVGDFIETARNTPAGKKSEYVQELKVLANSLQSTLTVFDRVLSADKEDIVWSSFTNYGNRTYAGFSCAPRDVSQFIADGIFSREAGGVVCSATLTVDYSFKYLSDTIGLHHLSPERDISEKIYYSPFLYADQMKLFTFSSDLNINSQDYLKAVAEQIDRFTSRFHKRMLVLCTSYQQTRTLKDLLQPSLHMSERRLFVQIPGSNRLALIRGYLAHPRAILIGTASFWEGVDLPGDKVEALMIVKIPFANPKEPMVIAKIQNFQREGKNAFMEYSVPDATVRMKQGFGRLIRSMEDTGICIFTDPRLLNARYGSIILDSFPVDPIPYQRFDKVLLESEEIF